ncbi:type II toxin-antitoxin system VapC family toxin [Wenzhouxiangella sp. AB-CW3]|uniref:type II toxin-antitoxin system VapC family toxin n=1 Tax=Wenzhouxiangella sp. AB-CW3 TaxID=2771012 RepID=UPI00168A4DA8|nr:type II toxin-antitoxin system VapC family toxin [Wenzhouxiangella sp. AB-CW3]QOC23770.1 type II toxin-antitoxin system VapC family toxin [Wenzhouxiangella sp. AB-CW3]
MAEQPAYFDTSVIAPLYRAEPLTPRAEALQEQWRPVISPLTEVELSSTVARWVRTGELSDDQATLVDKTFAEDLRLDVFERTELADRHYWQARAWLQKRTTNLRTLDALHLAVAAENGWPLITADRQLHEAAKSLGFQSNLAHKD